MDSLHAPCTPLKRKYDSCFNHWFDEYLRLAAPSVPPVASTSSNKPVAAAAVSHPSSQNTAETLDKEEQQRQANLKAKAEEYETRCGETWRAYRRCLETGLVEKDLKTLIADAREEFPLKLPKEVMGDAAE